MLCMVLSGALDNAHEWTQVDYCDYYVFVIVQYFSCVLTEHPRRYGVPASSAPQMEHAFRRMVPDEFARRPLLLHDLVTNVSFSPVFFFLIFFLLKLSLLLFIL